MFHKSAFAVLIFLHLFSKAAAQVKPNFYFYPQAARACLDQAGFTSRCEGKDTQSLNACLCGNGGNFITNTAICLGQNGRNELEDVYELMASACSRTKTPIILSPKEFVDAAESGDVVAAPTTARATVAPLPATTSIPMRTTSRAATLTTSSISTTVETVSSKILKTPITSASTTSTRQTWADKTETDKAIMDNGEDKGEQTKTLSKGAAIGIAIFFSLTSLVIIGVCTWFLRRRKRKTKQEGYRSMPSPKSFGGISQLPIPQPPHLPIFRHNDKLEYRQNLEPQVTTCNTEYFQGNAKENPTPSAILVIGYSPSSPQSRPSQPHSSHPEVAELPAEVIFVQQKEREPIFELESNEALRRYPGDR
ncbi:hypothetical protein VHEMI08444 [[Torrubiella] hemipterigena]|uniref:Extracellular membrane protein CFEM domain-containing protein n=1 Tax=[Torrubiella] hemipterigena TaxID=1531966 RepID=A0A0A1TDJ2_9HYPO|nr:hypothetical protein VHEMI08444 [[Torrubiella] hemipterigena]